MDFVRGASYAIKIGDRSTLSVNINGQATDSIRLVKIKPSGFRFPTFPAIHIPESERK